MQGSMTTELVKKKKKKKKERKKNPAGVEHD